MKPLDPQKGIDDYSAADQLMILRDICSRIYIARNITLDNNSIQDCLSLIDSLYREKQNFN